ncbi:MAG: ATP-dependent RecD-like DNA helicase [Defluviitaleaceae bacterium]|nr:ATP-dependent RecD-like DNA helicase [Defluviitaleaceae bacterium]MCL2835504.1 ATP-dependent RecD-like DNA helicase [Defluviitaleaceae bacterium]
MTNGVVTLEGSVENVIFRNDQNGYTVFEVLSVSGGDLPGAESKVTCTAFLPDISTGENVRLTGNFVMHPSYGMQFGVQALERSAPTSVPGIIKYLSSSVKGIGERTAKRITDMYGAETFDIIERHPDMLAKVPGITHKKARAISELFKEQSSLRHTMMYLQQFGVSPAFINKIYRRYKEESIEIVRRNPYLLAEDIIGIGFKTADAIAGRVGIEPDSEFRVRAGIKFILNEAARGGHVYLEKDELCRETAELLGVDGDTAENALHKLQFERQVMQDNQNGITAVYLNRYFYAESFVAKKLLELNSGVKRTIIGEENEIFRREGGFALAECQKQAVRAAFDSGVLVITGGPGTGKTTVINTLISLFDKCGLTVELAAPTGRAAKRMEEAAGREAKTIHRLLGMSGGDEGRDNKVERDEDNPIEADVVIIDESSMVDITLMYYLLRAIKRGTRLILVGDADQLPSVGPGNVLKDIIKSGEIVVARLTEIFRQSRESAIVMNAHRINQGERPELNANGRGFYFMTCKSMESVQEAITGLVRDRLPGYANADPLTEIQVLTPMRKSGLGAQHLNHILQQALNPPDSGRREKELGGYILREGDKVMQIKNNYNLAWRTGDGATEGTGVYNGDGGVIVKIDEDSELLRVCFDGGRLVDYEFGRLDELTPAYAVTIHKSQGSEYKVVVIPVFSGPPQLMTRNLLYTAVTRARELVVLVGLPETMYAMVRNNREVRRFSALDHRINKIKHMMAD